MSRDACWCTFDLRHPTDAEMLADYDWHWVGGFVQRVRIARHDSEVEPVTVKGRAGIGVGTIEHEGGWQC